jgi:GT2 family glycosyltransferase/cyanophycinase-like exopeptidase
MAHTAQTAGTLTLIGSGEFLPGMVAVHRSMLARVPQPRAVFIDTPAGFQTNADELSQAARAFFQKELGVQIEVASLKHSGRLTAEQIEQARAQIAAANYIIAGPGSPTYAIRHWRQTIAAALAQRLAEGAHLVFASSAAIALSHHALPVYELYKVGDDPHWAEGLGLLGAYGFDLAIVPHWNNREPRCFMGHARFDELAAQLAEANAVILGVDENTAVTLDLRAGAAVVAGAGGVTLQFKGEQRFYPAGTTFELNRLTPAHALSAPPSLSPAPPPTSPSPISDLPRPLYVPAPLREWAAQRDALRAEKKFAEADRLRDRMAAVGYGLKDSPSGPVFTLTQYSTSASVLSQLDNPDAVEWSVSLLARNNADEILRAARSALKWAGERSLEIVVVDDASNDETRAALADLACDDERVRLIFLKDPLGEGAGRNASLRAARGAFVAILGGHMEFAGDAFTPLAAALADDSIGVAGSNPLVTTDLFTFHPAASESDSARLVEADAVEFYLFAFRRARLKQVGWPDEKFVFYRNLDLDWSLAFKDKGLRLVGVPHLPLVVHEHPYLRLDPVEGDKLSRKNYRRFLDKWRERKDLLLSSKS